jgi:uncharacterized protein
VSDGSTQRKLIDVTGEDIARALAEDDAAAKEMKLPDVKREDKSHLLWTDDYLAAFAQAADAELITFDRALSRRYGSVRVTCLS